MSERKDAVIIQWSSGPYKEWLKLGMGRHIAYAESHGMDYWCIFGEARPEFPSRPVNWEKAHLIRQALLAGYDWVFALDSDVLIVGQEDLRNALPEGGIGAVWHASTEWAEHCYDHFNVGMLYLRNSLPVQAFVEDWLSRDDSGHPWHDQHVFNQLCPYSTLVREIDRRWHSTLPNHASEDPNPQVIAWHGGGSVEERGKAMLAYMQQEGR